MKNVANLLIILTTVFLLVFITLSSLDTSIKTTTFLFIIGNGLLILMVYNVLKDEFTTKKNLNNGMAII